MDYDKPIRHCSDILGMLRSGYEGWLVFDLDEWYIGSLPKSWGHRHKQQMIGRCCGGGHATAPTAAYPDKMCFFFVIQIFGDFTQNGPGKSISPCGGSSLEKRRDPVETQASAMRRDPV